MTTNIKSEHWKEGHKLPAEEDLAKEMNVSRGTLRKAISRLLKQGLLVQIQGKGTFVEKQKISYPFAQELVSFAESMTRKGYHFETEVISQMVIQPNASIQTKLEIGLYDLVLYVKRVRKIEGEAALLIENWVSLKHCPSIEKVDFTKVGLFEAIEKTCKLEISQGMRNFSATSLNKSDAEWLRLDEMTPVLMIDQLTFGSEGTPLECSKVLLRTDKYEISSVLRR